MDAPGGVQRPLQGFRPSHGLHLSAPQQQDLIVAHVHAAARQRPGVGPPDHELVAVQHAAAALLEGLRKEQDVPLLQGAAGGHVFPLGPVAVIVDQLSRRIEQLKQQGVVHVVLVEPGVALVVVQCLLIHPVVEGIKVQAQATQCNKDPVRHGPLVDPRL